MRHPAFFAGETSLGNGVYFLAMPSGGAFGQYSYLANGSYIYHYDLGYEYVVDANDASGGLYLYDFATSHWWYTSRQFSFPYVYDFSLNSFLYYYPDPNNAGRYTANPRFFYQFATAQIVTMPSASGGGPPPTIAQRHVLTGEYIGGYSGTHLVTPAQAGPYVDWASVQASDTAASVAAGMKTILYTDPNRIAPVDPLYARVPESGFAHTCGGSRLSFPYAGSIQYLADPASPALLTAWKQDLAIQHSWGHFDALYVDDSNDLWGFTGQPCGYSAQAWTQATATMFAQSGENIIYSALGDDPNAYLQLSAPSNVLGGSLEECYAGTSLPTPPFTSEPEWSSHEDIELQMAQRGKMLVCFNVATGRADQSLAIRTYVIASFLLTYTPSSSLLWESFTTPNGFRVLPESQLVPLDPVIASPSSVSQLRSPGGAYFREYRACYFAGSLVGECAVVVNPDQTASYPFPLSGYARSLTLTGNDVLSGGSAATDGPAPPAVMAPLSAAVVFR